MEAYGFSANRKSKKLGFHYYKDAGHFDDPSLDYWLPKLQAAGTSWLVVYAPENGEIPENFIIRLRDVRIEPVVVLNYSISNLHPSRFSASVWLTITALAFIWCSFSTARI